MPAYTEFLASLVRLPKGRIEGHIGEDWMQGRTTYGGLTAALCLESARALTDMPVRSAQIAFVGPVAGDVVISPSVLREGRNTLFASVDMVSEKGVMARCLFAFGRARESRLDFSKLDAPQVAEPHAVPSFFGERRPKFAEHFNVRLAAGKPPMSGASEADMVLWLRHKDEATLYDATTLLSLADAPPPAAMSMMTEPGPISSMTWMAEFLTDTVDTTGGWFLAHHVAQTARDGYSSQSMRLWNHAGDPVMVGRQTIAVFV